ncbi:MAG: radical SAM/SPASM domain-containing protein [Myxococcota bacterium]|nr:radical SAM/SPASM domain-containing protein [Myxococcota bacterium]
MLQPPSSVSIELTSICNIHCVCCPVGQGKVERGIMTEENFRKILELLPNSIRHIDFTHRGDPSCHPKFPQFVRMAHDTGRTTQAFTNGLILDRHIDGLVESGLTKLLVDVDGATPVSYLDYRVGSNFEKVTSNVRKLATARRESEGKFPEQLFTLCVVTSANEHEVTAIQEFARNLGADGALFKTAILNYGTKYYNDKDEQDALAPSNPDYLRPPRPEGFVCPFLWRGSILHDGRFLTCTADFEGLHDIGNILEEGSYEEVFYGAKARRCRKQIVDHSSPICSTCSVMGDDHFIASASKVFAAQSGHSST